jgi:hypothetical protein
MKKLERMDGRLFESLKVNEMTNLGAFVGGWKAITHDDIEGCEDTWKQSCDPFEAGDVLTESLADVINSDFATDSYNVDGSYDSDVFDLNDPRLL